MTPPNVIALEERFTSSKLRALRGDAGSAQAQ
jgi:hypothetical protein